MRECLLPFENSLKTTLLELWNGKITNRDERFIALNKQINVSRDNNCLQNNYYDRCPFRRHEKALGAMIK